MSGGSGSEKLELDGHTLVSDGIVGINEINIVSGVPVVIGYSAIGGNACDSNMFVVSFPPDQKPKFDGPIGDCTTVSVKVDKDRIKFSTVTLATHPGSTWKWTPEDGFKK